MLPLIKSTLLTNTFKIQNSSELKTGIGTMRALDTDK